MNIPLSDISDYVRGNPHDDNLQAPYAGPSDFTGSRPAISEALLEADEYTSTPGVWPGMEP